MAGGVSPAATGEDGVATTAAARTGGPSEDARGAWIVAAIVAVLLLGYLVVALVRPEKF